MKNVFLLLLLLLLPTTLFAELKPLPVDQAFSLSAKTHDRQTILSTWKIAPGYFLYRDRIHFAAANPEKNQLAQPLFPNTSIEKDYPNSGKQAVYKGTLTIGVPILQSQHDNISINVNYQGCSAKGFCYPPTTRVLQLNLNKPYGAIVHPIAIDLPPTDAAEITSAPTAQSRITDLLHNTPFFTVLSGFWVFGLLLSLTPCVLPMIPILSSIILGQKNITHRRSFFLSLAYVLGMAITYALAGVLFGIMGQNIQSRLQQPWIIVLLSLLFVGMALSLFGLFTIQLPERLRSRIANASDHQKRGSYYGVTIMGILSSLVLSPCVTPPLVGALTYIGQTGNALLGGASLFVMGLGMGTPLLLLGASSAKILPRAGAWMNTIKYALGVIMLAMAIWMLTRLLAPAVIMALWILLAMGCGTALGAFSKAKTRARLTAKILGLLLFAYGLLLLTGLYNGNTNPLTPLSFSSSTQQTLFTPVKNISSLKEQIEIARKSNKLLVLDFYADWCIACKEMDHLTFKDPAIQEQMKSTVALRADITRNNVANQALQKTYGVIAPPTLLFFYNGHEIKNSRIIGEVSAKKLLKHLQQLPGAQ